MSDTKGREQLIEDLRTIARRDLAFAPEHIPGHYASIVADLIESQAAQLAAAETRVVVLTDALKNASYALFQIKRMGGVTDAIKEFVIAENDKANAVLDSTDTAAQTLRAKHYEECAVIGDALAVDVVRDYFVGRGLVASDALHKREGIELFVKAIRAAAKEKP